MICLKTVIPALLLCLVYSCAGAQQCGNCKEIPGIALFDFDVQVPKPNAGDGTDQLWPEWKNLFMLASSVSAALKKNSGNCIKFMVVPSVDTSGNQGRTVGGETFTNLPSNPNISSDLSVYADYILTGTIKPSGEGLLMHVEVQTSCGRSVVATADVPFQLSDVVMNVSNLAQQAAGQLSPLADKIKIFELEERQKNKSLSLFKMSPGEPMKITPDKKTLKTGESTGFTIELKDCDGTPLAGREIRFTESSFNGFVVPLLVFFLAFVRMLHQQHSAVVPPCFLHISFVSLAYATGGICTVFHSHHPGMETPVKAGQVQTNHFR